MYSSDKDAGFRARFINGSLEGLANLYRFGDAILAQRKMEFNLALQNIKFVMNARVEVSRIAVYVTLSGERL